MFALSEDTTGDGKLDAFDTTWDGKVDARDTTGDGKVDAIDTTGDGKVDTFDTTGDGTADAFDTTGDGLVNARDTTGDGTIDAVDTTGDGKLNAFDTTGNGNADAFDTTGDGQADAWDITSDGKIDEVAASSRAALGRSMSGRNLTTIIERKSVAAERFSSQDANHNRTEDYNEHIHGIRNIGRSDVTEGTVIRAQGKREGLWCATMTEADQKVVEEEMLEQGIRALQLMPDCRRDEHDELLAQLLDDTFFIHSLGSRMMRRQCVKRLTYTSLQAGEIFYKEGFIGERMGIVIKGAISLDVFGETGRKKHDHMVGVGEAIGQRAMVGQLAKDIVADRTATAEVDTVLAVLTRGEYQCVVKMEEMQIIVNKFWVLVCPPDKQEISFGQYVKLQTRIAKSIQPFWDKKSADKVAREDWERDLALLSDVATQRLNQQQFSESMFQLVDEWCALGRGHASILTDLDTYHSAPLRSIGHPLLRLYVL
jgi:hypothetical protein